MELSETPDCPDPQVLLETPDALDLANIVRTNKTLVPLPPALMMPLLKLPKRLKNPLEATTVVLHLARPLKPKFLPAINKTKRNLGATINLEPNPPKTENISGLIKW